MYARKLIIFSIISINSIQWKICCNCNQYYQNDLAFDLATEFEKFMYAKYPGDPALQLEAMNLKIVVIFVSKLFMTKEQRNVAKKIAKKMIATFNRIPFPTDPSLHILSYTYNALGEVYLSEGTKESAEIAVEYFEKDLEVSKQVGDAVSIDTAKQNIVRGKAFYEGGNMFINSNRSLQEHTSSLEAHRKEYNAYNKEIQAGALGPAPINAATNFGYALLNALHTIEAQRVLAELQSLSTRVHGADHASTKQIEKVHNHMKFRCVLVDLQGSGKKAFQALRYTDEGKYMIVKGPMIKNALSDMNTHKHRYEYDITNRKDDGEREFTIPAVAALPNIGSPVVCVDFEGPLSYLNGKLGDMRMDEGGILSWLNGRSKVYFEDKDLQPRPIDQKNLRVLFDIPKK